MEFHTLLNDAFHGLSCELKQNYDFAQTNVLSQTFDGQNKHYSHKTSIPIKD